ncbi:MAG TPA: PIG-L family deacetylase, partial [Bacillota bacterium]|nr:PIG-L family deacetylase [Bacillota bacterium]
MTPDQMPVLNKKTRLLVIAPHCDDETLGSFGLIDTVLKRGGQVQVAVLTNGDASHSAVKYFQKIRLHPPDYIRFGEIRCNESRKVLKAMNVSPANSFFLTYPDKGLSFLWSKNWNANHPYTSNYTGANYSPYPDSYHPKTTYAGANLSQDLREIINRFRPSIIVYPHPDERHPDHWVAYAFVKYVLEGWYNQKPRELLYLVHYNQWPQPLGLSPAATLEPPAELTDTAWVKPTLSPGKIDQKRRLITTYNSQMTYLPQFMLSFARKNELYGNCKPTKLLFPETGLALYEPSPAPNQPIPPGRISSLNLTYIQNQLTFRLQIKGGLEPNLFYYLDLTLFQKKNPPLR